MRFGVLLLIWMLGATVFAAPQRGADRRVADKGPDQYGDLGPEMTAYMGFIDAEEAELKHLFDVGEVPPPEYKVSRDRLLALREAALRVSAERGDDVVPDLYILRASELTQVLPEGLAAVKGKKTGSRIGDDWLYHGRIRKGEDFYILERIGGISRDPYN